jgi:hypothetical protein
MTEEEDRLHKEAAELTAASISERQGIRNALSDIGAGHLETLGGRGQFDVDIPEPPAAFTPGETRRRNRR